MNPKTSALTSRLRYRLVFPALLLGCAAPLLASCANDDSAANAAPQPAGEQRELVRSDALPAATRTALNRLFADREAMGETRALLVLRDGEPIYEAYAPGFGPDSKLISWSMAKSITAVLIGQLVADGRLVLDDPAPVPEWQRPGDPRGEITLRHLLHMASGLDHRETGEPIWDADTVQMLFGAHAGNMAAMAEAKPPVARPDELFNYSTATSVILSDIIARALTNSSNPVARRDAVRDFMVGRLTGPLGMQSVTPEFDAAGTMIGGSIIHATARDYARFGEMLRRRGETPSGQQIVPENWVEFMLSPSPANRGYGAHIWLNRSNGLGTHQPLWPGRGSENIYAALGHQGQFIIVSPDQKLTVVRLGISINDTQIPNVTEALRQAMAGL